MRCVGVVHRGRVAGRAWKNCWTKDGKRSGFRTELLELYERTGEWLVAREKPGDGGGGRGAK